jgi:hypothetical protein
MSLKNSGFNDELNCYIKIIDCFLKYHYDNLQKEMCKNRSIIKLMRSLKYRKNKEVIKNSLLFVLSLFDDEDNPPDFYSNIGNDFRNATDKEHKEIISELKKEFL